MKIKVIQLSHASHSYFVGKNENLKSIILNDWYYKAAKQIKKYHPEIDVECWAPEKLNHEIEEIIEEGIKLRFFPVTFSPIYALDFSIPLLKELKKEIKKSCKEGYKLIIHLHEYHNFHGLAIASLFSKQKIIAQHHGGSSPIKHLKQTRKYRYFFPLFLLGQFWENFALKNIKVFYALSEEEIDYLKKVAPNSKVKFQTMGIDEGYFDEIPKSLARKKLGFGNKEKIIIYMGRITEMKGIRYLLDAMKQLEGIRLFLLGYGPEKEKLEIYAKESNIKNVEFLGGVFGDKKMLYLSSADCLVLPSLKEGAPVVVMEAFSKNLPVIVTNVGGVGLMVEDKKNGLLIKQRDSGDITRAVKEFFEKPIKNVKKYANDYKWKKIINDTVKDYMSIINQ